MSRPRTSGHVYDFLGITKQQASNLGGLEYLCGLEASEIFTLINFVKRNTKFYPKERGNTMQLKMSPAQQLRAARCLTNVQRLQSRFWQSLLDLENALEDITGETSELDDSKDFNDLNLEHVLAGHANDGGGR